MADSHQASKRQVFVGHPYRLFDRRDYRKVFRTVGAEFQVEFLFADEKITGRHIMEKISDYIADSDFSIFDISGWNPNVTLELGLAWGLNRPFFLLLNPKLSRGGDAPSDIKGIDRLDWSSFTELEEQLTKLLAQEVGVKPTADIDQQLDDIRKRIIDLLKSTPALRTEEIAARLNVNSQIVKVIMRALVEERRVSTTGQRRGMKYTLKPSTRTKRGSRRKSPSTSRKRSTTPAARSRTSKSRASASRTRASATRSRSTGSRSSARRSSMRRGAIRRTRRR